jgi:hypothetical protein
LRGAPRIHGELQKLGINGSERTVSRMMPRQRPPSQTWRTFLANHVASMVSMDFFTVSTLTGRILFVLVVLSHDRRRVVECDRTSYGDLDGATGRGRLPQRDRAPVATARPRQHLQPRVPPSRCHDGHRGSCLGSSEPLAEPVRRASYRIYSPRVPRSHHHPQSQAPLPRPVRLHHVLPSQPNASQSGQGCLRPQTRRRPVGQHRRDA